jgi:4-amino-4-deoxy-L-arabinose transferase-like glycosyltransferase
LSAQTLVPNKPKAEVRWHAPLLLLLVCLALYFFRLGNFGILEGGESYYPAAAREMIEAREWLVPHLNYQIYFSKPILTFWLIESAYVLFGVNELAGRLWSAILCTILVYFCYFTTRALAGARAGLLAGLMLASSPLLLATCRRSSIDAFFSCFFGIALCAMIMVLFAGRKRWWPIIYAGLALSVLTKGPASLILFVAGLIAYLLLKRLSIKQIVVCLRKLRVVPGTLIFLAMVLPWYVAVGQATKGLFLKVFFLYENLSRFAGNTNSGKHPHWWAYLPALIYGAFPWSLFLPAAVTDACLAVKNNFVARSGKSTSAEVAKDNAIPHPSQAAADQAADSVLPMTDVQVSAGQSQDPIRDVLIFSLAYVLVTVIFFSLSRTQFDRYILPTWCPLVIMISLSIDKWIRTTDRDSLIARSAKFVSPLLAVLGGLCLIASIAASFMIPDVQLWMRMAVPIAALVLAYGWISQYLSYRKKNFDRSMMLLATSTCLGYAIVTPVLFEYWYEKTYAGVHQLVISVADTDADVGQYKEFMPSLLYYRRGPVNFFYHLSQLLPRKKATASTTTPPEQTSSTVASRLGAPASLPASMPTTASVKQEQRSPTAASSKQDPSSTSVPSLSEPREPIDHRTFILVKKDFEPELLAQPQLNLKLNSRRGEWSMYETSDFVMDKPPTLEESFNRLNWKDSMTDKFGFGPLTVPYSGGHMKWRR